MEILGERPVWSMSGGEMLSSLDAAFAEIARLETVALNLIAGLETTGYAKELGAGTTARLLTFRYRIDATDARRDVQLANTLPKYPAVAAALPDPNPNRAAADTADESGLGEYGTDDGGTDEDSAGEGVLLHPAQAAAIVSALEKVPTTVPADDVRVAERELVELARTHGPRQLRQAGKQFRDRLDTDGPEPDEHKAYDRETLTLKNTDNGVDFRGYLANENAELFRTLIHTHAKPHKTIDGALDPRSRTKRQADALTTVLTAANNPTARSTGHHGTNPAAPATSSATDSRHGTTTADTADPGDARGAGAAGAVGATTPLYDSAETLPGMPPEEPATSGATITAGHRPVGGPARDPGHGAAGTATDAGHRHGSGFIPGHGPKAHITVTIDFNDLKAATADKIGHLIYGDGLSAATIRRLACDAQILPVVLGSDSQPLDVGTTVRLATGPMRKALITRDKGCVCCGAPPIYCDAHHVKSWIDGGETKITNLVLLCKRCHRDLHAGHWNIEITNGVVHVARPAWATPDPVPRGRYRPPTIADSGSTNTGTAARVWPRDTDPPWITTDDAARLNPWGEIPEDRSAGIPIAPADARIDPWGETSEDGSAGIPKESADARIDPWGDGRRSTVNVDRRSKVGMNHSGTFDPWGELVSESDNRVGPGDDGPKRNRGTVDRSRDSAEPRGATTAA
jgi:hypothetical protein